MVTENEMLAYFIKENKAISLNDLFTKYRSYGGIHQVAKVVNALEAKGAIEKIGNQNHEWIISNETRLEIQKELERREEIKSRKELEDAQIKSVIETNKSSKRSNIWSPVFAGLAALAAILSFITAIIQHKQTEGKTEQLQTQLTQQGNALKIQQMQIDSLFTKVDRRDTVPKAL